MPLLRLLGPVLLDAEPLPDHLTTHLLVLLAVHPQGLVRARVAQILWPTFAPDTAARNLRKTLHRLRADGRGALLAEHGGRLTLAVDHDLALARRALADTRPQDALDLMRGPLADDLRDEAGWLGPARHAALDLWREALLKAVPRLPAARAEAELERLRALEPHDEALLRAHLACLAAAGRSEARRRVQASYLRALADDLGVAGPPDLQTPDPPPEPTAVAPPPAPVPAAAQPALPLLGRDDELALALSALQAPGSTLLLRGPGGVGKTRLALALAEHLGTQGRVLRWWPLAGPGDPWARLASTLGVDDPRDTALRATLAAAPTLLVADEAEDLADDAAFQSRLATLVASVPSLSLLVTSRRSLPGLRELRVGTLDGPDPGDPPGAVLRNPAVRLFVEAARRVQLDFAPHDDAALLGRIVRAAGGLPLALHLAAGRVRHARLADIATALEAGDGGLDPQFEAAWAALPQALQQPLASLAALPEDFDRLIAEAAAGLRPTAFDALAARSLVEPAPDGRRWRLHPLLRLWLRAQHPAPGALAAAQRAALQQVEAAVARHGPEHLQTLQFVDAELPLLRGVFNEAVAAADAALLGTLTPLLSAMLDHRGRRPELQALLQDAAARLAAAPLAARAPVQAARAHLAMRQGRLDEAQALAEGLQRARGRPAVAALLTRGLLRHWRGDYAGARALAEQARQSALTQGLDDLGWAAMFNIAFSDSARGRFDDAEAALNQLLVPLQAHGAVRLQTRTLFALSALMRQRQRLQAAREHADQAAALVQAHGLASLHLEALIAQGGVAVDLDDMTTLRRLLPAMRAAAPAGDAAVAVNIHAAELMLATADNDRAALRAAARAGWDSATALGHPPRLQHLVLLLCQYWKRAGELARAARWLAWLRDQPGRWPEVQKDGDALWATLPEALQVATVPLPSLAEFSAEIDAL